MSQTPARRLAVERLEDRLQPAVTYHGGAIMPHVEAQAVFIGSDWNGANLSAKAQALQGFLATLVNSSYMDALTAAGYGVGRGSVSGGATWAIPIDKNYYFTDGMIQRQLQKLISAGYVQQPDANRLYVVYTEPGVAVWDAGSDSTSGFLGYHGAFGGRNITGQRADIRYLVIPHPGGWNPTPQSQGFPTGFTDLTAVTSHELAEAVTDPDLDYKAAGWYDDQYNAEIGDLTNDANRVLNGYWVQLVVAKDDTVLNVPGATDPAATAANTRRHRRADAVNLTHVTQQPQTPGFARGLDIDWGVRVG